MTFSKKLKTSIFITFLLFFSHSFAMVFTGTYNNSSRSFIPSFLPTMTFAYNMNINGTMKSWKKINLHSINHLQGVGYLEAPEIVIMTKKFDFAGTINFSKKCTIITCDNNFSESTFVREGEGKLNIQILSEKEFNKRLAAETLKQSLSLLKYPLVIGGSIFGGYLLYKQLKKYW